MPVFMEGFEGNSWANLQLLGWTSNTAPTTTTSNAHKDFSGRGGNYALAFNTAGEVVTTPGFSTTAHWLSFMRKTNKTAGGSRPYTVRFIRNGSITAAINTNATNNVQLWRGNADAGTLLATSTPAISTLATSHWISIKLTADSGSGEFEVYIDGSLFVSYSGNTQDAALNGWDQVQWTDGFFDFVITHIDDVIVTTAAEGMPSEAFIVPLSPTSDISISSDSSGGGAGTYANIDEIPQTSAEYNEFDSGETDIYGIENLTYAPATIYGEKISLYAARDGAVTTATTVVTVGMASLSYPNAIGSSATYEIVEDILNLKPGGGAWTAATINNQTIAVGFS